MYTKQKRNIFKEVLLVVMTMLFVIASFTAATLAWFAAGDVSSKKLTMANPISIQIDDGGTGQGSFPINIDENEYIIPGSKVSPEIKINFEKSNTPVILRAFIAGSVYDTNNQQIAIPLTEPLVEGLEKELYTLKTSMEMSILSSLSARGEWHYVNGAFYYYGYGPYSYVMQTTADGTVGSGGSVLPTVDDITPAHAGKYTAVTTQRTGITSSSVLTSVYSNYNNVQITFMSSDYNQYFRIPLQLTKLIENYKLKLHVVVQAVQDYVVVGNNEVLPTAINTASVFPEIELEEEPSVSTPNYAYYSLNGSNVYVQTNLALDQSTIYISSTYNDGVHGSGPVIYPLALFESYYYEIPELIASSAPESEIINKLLFLGDVANLVLHTNFPKSAMASFSDDPMVEMFLLYHASVIQSFTGIGSSITSVSEALDFLYDFLFTPLADELLIEESAGSLELLEFSHQLMYYMKVDAISTLIKSGIFDSLISVQAFSVEPSHPYYSTVDGVLYNKTQTKLLVYPRNKSNTTFTIPQTVVTFDLSMSKNLKKLSWQNYSETTLPDNYRMPNPFFRTNMPIYPLSLEEVVIPDSVTKLKTFGPDMFDGTFTGLLSLNTLTFSSSSNLYAVLIGHSTGSGWVSNLFEGNTLDLPSSVRYLGNVINNVQYLTLRSPVVVEHTENIFDDPVIDGSAYYSFNFSNIQAIYVPSGLVTTYKTHPYWSDYADKIHAIP